MTVDRPGTDPVALAMIGDAVPEGAARAQEVAAAVADAALLREQLTFIGESLAREPSPKQRPAPEPRPLPGRRRRRLVTALAASVATVVFGVGTAYVVAHGGAWYAGSPRRRGWDAGVGLRVGASRASDTEALRFDLARRFGNDAQEAGWVVIVGKGFVFSGVGKREL